MLFKGTMGTVYSGKVAGLVASRNKGGTYLRTLRIPTNPRTAEQVAVRNVMAGLSSGWKNLTDAQRQAWTVYAFNTPVINRVGDSVKIPALAMYNRCNVPRVQGGQPRIDDGPTTFGMTILSPCSASNLVAGPPSTVDIAFDPTDGWNVAGGGLFVYASRPQSPTINFFNGPYQLAGFIDGTGGATSPQTITLPFPIVGGQLTYFRAVASGADGRLSPATTFSFNLPLVANVLGVHVLSGTTAHVTFDVPVTATGGTNIGNDTTAASPMSPGGTQTGTTILVGITGCTAGDSCTFPYTDPTVPPIAPITVIAT